MSTAYLLYLALAFVAGDNIYQVWKLTRSNRAASSAPVTLGHLVLTLIIIVFFAHVIQWNVQVSISMWWFIAATTATYAGAAIWSIFQDKESKKACEHASPASS